MIFSKNYRKNCHYQTTTTENIIDYVKVEAAIPHPTTPVPGLRYFGPITPKNLAKNAKPRRNIKNLNIYIFFLITFKDKRLNNKNVQYSLRYD